MLLGARVDGDSIGAQGRGILVILVCTPQCRWSFRKPDRATEHNKGPWISLLSSRTVVIHRTHAKRGNTLPGLFCLSRGVRISYDQSYAGRHRETWTGRPTTRRVSINEVNRLSAAEISCSSGRNPGSDPTSSSCSTRESSSKSTSSM